MSGKQTVMILAMATVIQLPLLFIGIDLSDTGFYMTFYDLFYDAPGSVEYNFMYWLTGLVGGAWHSVWPGLFSLRVLALLVNLWTVWVLTRMVSDWRSVMLAAGVVLTGLYVSPLTFNYDTLTASLTVTGLWLMLRSDGSWKWMFAAGIVMGINVFSRISNLAGLGYILFPLVGAVWDGRKMLRGALAYLAGWLAGVGLILLLMSALGHLNIFVDNVRELFLIAGASGDEASHGMGNLIAAQFGAWWRIFKFACVAGVLLLVFLWTRKSVHICVVRFLIYLSVALAGTYIIYCSAPVTVAAGIGLTGCVAVFYNSGQRSMWNLSLCGLLMMFIMPLGSDGGIYNNGTLATWLSLTVAFVYFIGNAKVKKSWFVPGMRASLAMACVFCLIMALHVFRNGFYFDESRPGDRLVKVYGQLAYTSGQRTELIDALVNELNGCVSPGDTLMVYGSGPMLNYLTHTRPWLGCSWPEQFMETSLRHRLETAPGHPVIAIVKFNTLGARFGSPSEDFARGGDENIYHNRRKSAVVYDFLETHGYSLVHDGEFLAIYEYTPKTY